MARRAVALTRERFGAQRVAVIGDRTPQSLDMWSEIILATWGMSPRTHEPYEVLSELTDAARIDVLEAKRVSPHQMTALDSDAVEV